MNKNGSSQNPCTACVVNMTFDTEDIEAKWKMT